MNKQHLNAAVEFGKQLIETQYLDPVYTVLHRAKLSMDQLKRLIVAYSCLYHLGASALLSESEGKVFFQDLHMAAVNRTGEWPRGTERRHWRGQNALVSVDYMRNIFKDPLLVMEYWFQPTSYESITNRIKECPSFGPWIAWKLADIGERVFGCDIDFAHCDVEVYRDPRQGAALLMHGNKDAKLTAEEFWKVVHVLNEKFIKLKAPPSNNRKINIQEIETVLCKYKSHCNGHYEIGKDSLEVLHGLSQMRWGETARNLYQIALNLECVR